MPLHEICSAPSYPALQKAAERIARSHNAIENQVSYHMEPQDKGHTLLLPFRNFSCEVVEQKKVVTFA
jgi:hypothetical protein